MTFRKFQADHLFDGYRFVQPNHVLITDDEGTIREIILREDAGDDVQQFNGILTPGFVNCHCHLELSHMKGLIPENTGLVDFVFKVVSQRHFPEEEIATAIEAAENEMRENGIVAVGDICNNASTLQQKLQRHLHYYNFIEASGWLPSVVQTRFSKSKEYYELFANNLPQTSLVPHAPYSVSEKLWEMIAPYFSKKTVTIHNQETSFEDNLFLSGTGDFERMYKLMNIDNTHHQPTGKSSLQSYFTKMQPAANVMLVHNSFTPVSDIQYAMQQAKQYHQQLFWCICINANKYIENKIPPINELMANKANIVLGTDSLASNHCLNLLEEMKSIQQSFPNISVETMLQWATSNGAAALQMNQQLGSFEKGKKPGIVIIEKVNGQQLNNQSTSKRIL